jgi:xanthine dehydrogenase accessory factor
MDGWQVIEQAAELSRQGTAFALATVVWRKGPSSSQLGSRAIITAHGELHGWIGGACAEPAVIREAQQVISSGTAKLLLLGSPEQFGSTAQVASAAQPGGALPDGGALPADSTVLDGRSVPDGMTVVPISCQSEGALEVYIEPVLPVPHLVVVGRSPMAQTLTDLARALGWRAKLIDGPDFTSADANARSLVVVATQGHDDEGVLERAVAARPAYLGLVGSRKRGAAVLGYLADRGLPKADMDRVRVPAGLDLGRTTHQEVAVAILAELVQLRAAGALATDAAVPGAESTDPVCGMTVPAGPEGLPLERNGVTYYFCCTGCRQTFEDHPAAHPSGY